MGPAKRSIPMKGNRSQDNEKERDPTVKVESQDISSSDGERLKRLRLRWRG